VNTFDIRKLPNFISVTFDQDGSIFHFAKGVDVRYKDWEKDWSHARVNGFIINDGNIIKDYKVNDVAELTDFLFKNTN